MTIQTLQGALQQSIRNALGCANDFNGDLHAMCDLYGIPAAPISGRLIPAAQKFDASITTASSALNYFLQNPQNACGTLALDFTTTSTLDPRITFSRGSQATLFDSTGTLKYAKHNLLLQSQTFSSASWSKTNVTETSDTTAAPDGTTTADTLLFAGGGLLSGIFQTSISYVSGFVYTQSVFAKYIDQQWIQMTFGSAAFGSSQYANFDIQNGVVGGVAGGTASIVSVGNNWYRCIFTATATSTASSTGGQVTGIDGIGAIRNATLTASSTSVYLWGAQLNIANMEGGVTSSLTTYYPTTTAAYYAPRFDYNPSTLQPLGLLIEEARTNLFLQSQFAASWINFGTATQTINNAVAPDGTTTANLVSSPAATDYVYQAPTTVIGTSYAFSFFVKNSTATVSFYQVRTSSTAAFGTLTWSGATLASATATTGTVSFAAVGNGWYRVTAIYTATETAARHRIGGGDNTSTTGNILVWGAQLEAGAFATSYIPTTTTALTRSADVASMTGTNFSSWYNASEGTLYAESSLQGFGTTPAITSFSDGTDTGNLIQVNTSGAGLVRYRVVIGGVAQVNNISSGVTATANTFFKYAAAYEASDFAISVNGATAATQASGSVPSPTQLRILQTGSGGSVFSGTIRRIAYYPTRLPDATLQGLTA
jgi:hypothetical protein